MIFSVSNDGIEWSLHFGPDSVTLTVKDLVHQMTISCHEIPLAAWSLSLSQSQQFSNNHLAWVPVTPNQHGTHEVRDEVLSSVGAQEGLDTSRYQVSADLDDVEFYSEAEKLDVDVVFRPGVDTPFSPAAFDDLETGLQQKTIFSSTTRKTGRTLLQQQHHQSLRDQHGGLHCWELVHLEQEWKIFLIMFIEICFSRSYCVCVLI